MKISQVMECKTISGVTNINKKIASLAKKFERVKLNNYSLDVFV